MRTQVVVDENGKMGVQVVVEEVDLRPRGKLGNEIVSLGSEMVRLREQIPALVTRIKSKQIGKGTPEKMRLQRETDLRSLEDMRQRLAVVEGQRAGLRWVEKEVFGGP